VATTFLDPSGNQLLVGASLDEQLRSLLLPGLVQSSLEEANRQARDLGQQVSAPRGQLGEAGKGLSLLRLDERATGSSFRVLSSARELCAGTSLIVRRRDDHE
jgi:hypothetical protein